MPIPLGILAVAGAAAGTTGSFDLLETTLISTNTASVTFSGLGSYSNYKHLQVRATIRNVESGQTNLTFNSDTGANYAIHRLQGNGSAVSSAASTSISFISLQDATTNDNEANNYSALVLDILDFSSSSKNTTTRVLHGKHSFIGGTAIHRIWLASGLWNNTAAVTSMTITPNSGNIVAGSRFSLYGIK